jgi:two-component system sensor histidine kinase/response regulator
MLDHRKGVSTPGDDAAQPIVLVVDDDPQMREVVSLVLGDEGYRVLQAGHGEAALSLMEHARPDLILSDAMMPGMDGFTLCKQVRAHPQWSHIPFVFLTARGQRTDLRHGMDLGADDYLMKPFEPEELLSAIRARLGRAAQAQTGIRKATDELRDTVIRTLSHEFRTPLTLILGYTELLEANTSGLTDQEFHEFLQGLRAGSGRLENLVEDFLLLSQLQTGAFADQRRRLPRQMVEPDRVVSRTLERFASQASARNVELALHAWAAGTLVAMGEQDLTEIVRRLTDNTIKFSKQGGGQVALSTRQEEGFWVLDVADTGIGMPQEALSWIFEAFRQVDRPRMEQQGAGLGLAIVRGLAELYGGCVTVKSEPGKGSTFTVRLPVSGQRPDSTIELD